MRASQVQRVFRSGTPSHGSMMVAFVAPGSGGISVVASRKVGGAVERNRAKRILRAAWLEIADDRPSGVDVVLVARESIRGMRTLDLKSEMTRLVRIAVPQTRTSA